MLYHITANGMPSSSLRAYLGGGLLTMDMLMVTIVTIAITQIIILTIPITPIIM